MKFAVFALLQGIVSLNTNRIEAHSRWKCPEPRSPQTGIKSGPCGDETNDFNSDQGLEVKPGLLRIVFEESVHHTGAPFRISLSQDGNDDDSCVLLDHVPHNDCCRPRLGDETTYTPYVITVNIPNIICEKCSLHLSNPMTDKIGSNGSPTGIGCTDPGTCFSVYHSCTKPFRIVGDEDAVPRSEYECRSENTGWPQSWAGDYGENVDASTPLLYRRESSFWSETDYTLTMVPPDFTVDAGGVCGEKFEQASIPDNSYNTDDGILISENMTFSNITTMKGEDIDASVENWKPDYTEQSSDVILGESIEKQPPHSSAPLYNKWGIILLKFPFWCCFFAWKL